MALKTFRPLTPTLRHASSLDYAEITATKPEKSLTCGIKSTGGRNNRGRITTRFRGGAVKRSYRLIDFRRAKEMVATVKSIEYDPNRTAFIALICYEDGEKAYILAPVGVKVGDKVASGAKSEIKPGNALKLRDIPVGVNVHNIEMQPGRGGKVARSAGQTATVRSKDENYAQVKLSSGEVRMINIECRATIGQVSNLDHMNVQLGKAGKKRYKGRRPHVRGVVMNPVDHPMGGGEGRTCGGSHPCSPWGQLSKGGKTRRPKKQTNRFIIERRKK